MTAAIHRALRLFRAAAFLAILTAAGGRGLVVAAIFAAGCCSFFIVHAGLAVLAAAGRGVFSGTAGRFRILGVLAMT